MNVGDTFLGYTVEAQLGEGGNGYTYRVSREGIDFTLKELRLGFKQGYDSYKQGVEMFERECRALRSITHPLVPRFVESHIDKTTSNHKFFFVSDFVPGETLATTVRNKQLSLEEVTRAALNLASVLEHIHSFPQPIIHRDVKPENIIISPDGLAHLIDFGSVNAAIAKSINFTTAGTFGYSAFESLCGGDAYPESDIYALGATLMHVLSGGKDIMKMMDRLNYTPKIKGNVPAVFEPILERMMAKDYLARATLGEVKDFFSRREVIVGELVDDSSELVARRGTSGNDTGAHIRAELAQDSGSRRQLAAPIPASMDLEIHGGIRNIIPVFNSDFSGSIITRKGDTAPIEIVAVEDGLEGVVKLSKPVYRYPLPSELEGVFLRTKMVLEAYCDVLFPQKDTPIYNLRNGDFVPIEVKMPTVIKTLNHDYKPVFRNENKVETWRLRADIKADNFIGREQSYMEIVRDNRGLIRRGVQRLGSYDPDTINIMTVRVYERWQNIQGRGVFDYLIDIWQQDGGDLSFCVNRGSDNYKEGRRVYKKIVDTARILSLNQLERGLADNHSLAPNALRFIFHDSKLYKNLGLKETAEKNGLDPRDLNGFYPQLPRTITEQLERQTTVPNVVSSAAAPTEMVPTNAPLESRITGGDSSTV